MAKQTRKQRVAVQSTKRASVSPIMTWKGQLCEIVGNEPVRKADNTVVLCAKIKILGMPLHQGLRLVPSEELAAE